MNVDDIWNAIDALAERHGFSASGLARVAGLTVHLVPVFGVGLAVLLLDERLETYHAAGIVLIAFGVWLATRNPASRRPA